MFNQFVRIIHFFYDEKLLPFNRENTANYITLLGSWLSRFGLYMFIVYLAMFWYNQEIVTNARIARGIAIALLALGAFCDGIDGFVARRYGLSSPFGELFDPHHDKVQYATKTLSLVIDASICVLTGLSLAFLFQVLLISYFTTERDQTVMFHRLWAIRESPDIKISAGKSGKWRTRICFPGILLMFLIMKPYNLVWLGWIITVLILCTTIYSIRDYVKQYRTAIRTAREQAN